MSQAASSLAPHSSAHAGLANLLVRVPPRVRESFTTEQIAALSFATSAIETQHVLANRRTFGFLGRHYYFAMFLGRCRRHRPTRLERFIHRGLKHSRRYRAAKVALVSSVVLACIGCMIIGLYVVKSALHIDLLPGPSIFHGLVY